MTMVFNCLPGGLSTGPESKQTPIYSTSQKTPFLDQNIHICISSMYTQRYYTYILGTCELSSFILRFFIFCHSCLLPRWLENFQLYAVFNSLCSRHFISSRSFFKCSQEAGYCDLLLCVKSLSNIYFFSSYFLQWNMIFIQHNNK